MSRYIDADRLEARIKASPAFQNMGQDGFFLREVVLQILAGQPTADVVEVRHGEYHNTRFTDGVFYQEQCSICGEWTYEYDKNFCPHCGAKMDGERSKNGKT